MPADECRHERALRHHLQPLVARAVQRGADQLGCNAPPLDLCRDVRMGKDDPLALALIGGQRAMTADVQFEFNLVDFELLFECLILWQ
jgi:hypothetical protein